MCLVCENWEDAAGDGGAIVPELGPVAQPGRAPAWHAGGRRFNSGQVHPPTVDGFTLAGFVAGEGSFCISRKLPPYADGSPRLCFRFAVTVATRDRPMLETLRGFLGVGSIFDRAPRRASWQPTSTLCVNSVRAHHAATIPFAEQFLLPSAKRRQFEAWRDALAAYEVEHPVKWGKGPSPCGEPSCNQPVRGRGLCRSHYYRATGY